MCSQIMPLLYFKGNQFSFWVFCFFLPASALVVISIPSLTIFSLPYNHLQITGVGGGRSIIFRCFSVQSVVSPPRLMQHRLHARWHTVTCTPGDAVGKELIRLSCTSKIEGRLGSAGEDHFIRRGYEEKKLLKDSLALCRAGGESCCLDLGAGACCESLRRSLLPGGDASARCSPLKPGLWRRWQAGAEWGREGTLQPCETLDVVLIGSR